MKKNTLLTLFCLLPFATSSLLGTTVSFTAQQGTAVSSLTGTHLSNTTVEIGHYASGTFTSLGSTATGGNLPAGLFGGSAQFDSSSLTTAQVAMRIFSDDGGSVIAYSTTWRFSGGDGSGTDTNTDNFDLVQAVAGGALTTTGVVVASPGSQFSLSGATNPTFNSPSISVGVVPEPSTYAMLAGALALGYVMIRRRK